VAIPRETRASICSERKGGQHKTSNTKKRPTISVQRRPRSAKLRLKRKLQKIQDSGPRKPVGRKKRKDQRRSDSRHFYCWEGEEGSIGEGRYSARIRKTGGTHKLKPAEGGGGKKKKGTCTIRGRGETTTTITLKKGGENSGVSPEEEKDRVPAYELAGKRTRQQLLRGTEAPVPKKNSNE